MSDKDDVNNDDSGSSRCAGDGAIHLFKTVVKTVDMQKTILKTTTPYGKTKTVQTVCGILFYYYLNMEYNFIDLEKKVQNISSNCFFFYEN